MYALQMIFLIHLSFFFIIIIKHYETEKFKKYFFICLFHNTTCHSFKHVVGYIQAISIQYTKSI